MIGSSLQVMVEEGITEKEGITEEGVTEIIPTRGGQA